MMGVPERIEKLLMDYGQDLVRKLSERYGFDLEEGLRLVNLSEMGTKMRKESKGRHKKPSVPLPWTGVVVECWCRGLRPNHGLISQCTQEAKSDGLCGTCLKQSHAKGKPKCGTVDLRMTADEKGEIYKNPETGKPAVKYGTVMAKLNIDRKTAETEAAKLGITIPESEFEVEIKKQGRPRKEAKPTVVTSGDDVLANLVKQAVASSASGTPTSSDSENESGGPKFSDAEQIERKTLMETLSTFETSPEYHSETITPSELKIMIKECEEKAKHSAELAKLEPTISKIIETDGEFANAPEDLMTKDIKFIKNWIKEYKRRKKDAEKAAKDAEKAAKKTAKEAAERTKLIAKMAKFKNPPDFDSESITIDALKELIKTTKENEDAAKEQVKKERAEKKAGKKSPEPVAQPAHDELKQEDPIYDAETEDEENETQVVEFEHEGKTYYRSDDNILFDPKTHEAVGLWNEEKKTIDEIEEPDTDEEEEA